MSTSIEFLHFTEANMHKEFAQSPRCDDHVFDTICLACKLKKSCCTIQKSSTQNSSLNQERNTLSYILEPDMPGKK